MKIFIEVNMKLIIVLSCVVLAASVDPSPRSVNVALETSFLFEPKSVNENISFIKNIKDFLDKLYKILEPQAKLMQNQKFRSESEVSELKPERKFGFFDWLKNAGQSFLNMTGSKFEEAASVIKEEVSKVAEKGTNAIKDILPNPILKARIDDSMEEISQISAHDLRDIIDIILKDENLGELAKKMNAYYNDEEVKKLQKLLRKFTKYIDADMDTSKIVKEMFQVVLFDKYKSLNETAKALFIKDFELVRDYVKENNIKLKGLNQQSTSAKRVDIPTVQLLFGEKVNPTEDSKPKQLDSNKDYRRNERKNVKKGEKKKGSYPNEIVVDNVELFVQSLIPKIK